MSETVENRATGRPKPVCTVVRAGAAFTGKQALSYAPAISAEAVGSSRIHMQLVTIPPGAMAKAHYHENHETALLVLSGTSSMWYGEDLAEHLDADAGDFVYIPAGVPHQPYNPGTEPCTAVIARTDPNEQESVVLLPQLEGRRQPRPR
jgi:uncharacterized RmlC-like cupin family protein